MYLLAFYIVNEKDTPLLNKDACKLLGVVTFAVEFSCSVCRCSNTDYSEFPDVCNGLACLDGEIHLQIDPSVSAVVHPCKIPVSLRN